MKTRNLMGGASLAATAAAMGPAFARADDEGEHKEEGEKADAMLKTTIADMKACMDAMTEASAKMDAMGKRMDEAEEREKAREDRARKDAEEAMGAENGKPAETAADRARRDAEEDVREEKARQDRARKDAEEKDEKERADRAMADAAKIEKLETTIADLTGKFEKLADVANFVHRPTDDATAAALADAQAQADGVFALLGKRAERPLANEAVPEYRRRMARALKHHSRRYADSDLQSIPDGAVLDGVVEAIYADAAKWAKSPAAVSDGQLIAVPQRRPGGGERVGWNGSTRAWMLPMSAPAQAVRKIFDA